MSNLSCGTHVAEPSANKDCRKLLNQFCRFLPKLKLPISADAKLPLTQGCATDRERIQPNHEKAFLLNIGAGNGVREARIYFPISSFKAPDTFQIS